MDTVVLVGSTSTQFAAAKPAFVLGCGVRLLRPVFAHPGAWRVVVEVIRVILCTIAATLAVRV